MAHYVRVASGQDTRDGITGFPVVEVIVVANSDEPSEGAGVAWCQAFQAARDGHADAWLKTSYNAASNGFRKNFAGEGFLYDALRDAFIPPKPEGDSFVFNEDACRWQPPSPGENYVWDQASFSWQLPHGDEPGEI